jgi:hypothetical protein
MSADALAQLLRQRPADVLDAWAGRYERSPLRLHREVGARTYVGLVAPLCDALAVALVDDGELRPGHAGTRDLEQGCAFIGARLATSGAVGFDVAAVITALRDAVAEFAAADLHPALERLFEWLVILALDAFSSATRRSIEERAAEQLEIGTPVLMVTPELPALILVGEPPPAVLDAILARALMAVIAASARVLIVDASGLAAPGRPELLRALRRWCESKSLTLVHLVLVGVAGEARRQWTELLTEHGIGATVASGFEAAVVVGFERVGVSLRRRG